MKKELIFRKGDSIKLIFYNGENKQEVLEFFSTEPYGKYLLVIDEELHYKVKSYHHNTLIKPNNYIMFDYDEDDWWCVITKSKEYFAKEYVSIWVDE